MNRECVVTGFFHAARLRLEAIAARWVPGAYRWLLLRWGRSNNMKVLMTCLVRDGDVVFDVGANRGILTAVMSNLAGAAGSIHAFEPSPEACRLLASTLADRASGGRNVRVTQTAVGDLDGTSTLHTPGSDLEQASLAPQHAGSWSTAGAVRTEVCEVVRLDTYVARHAIEQVDLLKIDVEGAELPVLRGFTVGLRTLKPAIVCELCGNWTSAFQYVPSQAIAELHALGYDRFFLVTDRGALCPLEDPAVLDDGISRDVLCLIAGKHTDRLRRCVMHA